jgi:hypothetical protein
MFRKLVLALAASATLGAAALAPTSASAWHHHHRHGHWGWGAAALGAGLVTSAIISNAYAAPSCVRVKRWVDTPYGLQLRKFWVC